MAARSTEKLPVEVRVASPRQKLTGSDKPDIEVKTGMTEGKKYLIRVTPKVGKAVLIAVHL